MSVLSESEVQQAPRSGLLLLQGLILAFFCLFAIRLWYLQVHKGGEFAELARNNQLREEKVYAPRGLLLDRDGRLLAVNEPAYALALVREDCQDLEGTLAQVGRWTGMPVERFREKIEQDKRRTKPFEPLVLVSDVSPTLLASVEANALFWPGLEIVVRPKRFYPDGALFSHVLGYVAEAGEEELGRDKGLDLGDNVGKQGIELILEPRLRGEKGVDQIEVDATGRFLKKQIMRLPAAGERLRLSIDLDLQRFAVRQLEGQAGAIVVMDPFSGQVLALVSQPGYDNNAFAAGLSPEQWAALRDDPMHPLQNRVVQSVYPPGSVWKLVMAGCGLNSGLLDPRETVYCPGHYEMGKRVFRCWKKEGHGAVDLRKALVESCDVYFYRLGERLGVDRVYRFAAACGFNVPTGIDLPNEKGGLVPSREWKRKRFGEPWHGGENLNLAIGQGYTLVSPLQVARFVSALVNGGMVLKPNLLLEAPLEIQGSLPLRDDQRRLILDAMVATVESPTGTAKRLRLDGASIGGKTGTAQVVKLMAEYEKKETEDIPYQYRDHAWMATFGEKDGKTYVVVAMIEHGGHGSSAAGPVVKAIYEYLFGGKAAAGKSAPPKPAGGTEDDT